MAASSFATFILFSAAFIFYLITPKNSFTTIESAPLWLFIILILLAVIAGNIRNITLPTVTTILVAEKERDQANGLAGTMMGISFAIASIASSFILALFGMFWVLCLGIVGTILTLIHLCFIAIPENKILHTQEKPKKIDVKGTIAAIKHIPGLFGLIFFNTLNNFLGGVLMPLMDPYGLSLVSLEIWGTLWGFLSMGFILGGLYIARKGLGKNPLKSLFRANIFMWFVCMLFAIQPSIILLSIGMFIWVCLVPFIEATEQTIIQKVVPPERQGRVFGFAQSVESTASPLTAFFIGPIAQFIFIPFMTTGEGVHLIGSWFGRGAGRGIALVFILIGIIGLIITLLAKKSRSYQLLSERYQE